MHNPVQLIPLGLWGSNEMPERSFPSLDEAIGFGTSRYRAGAYAEAAGVFASLAGQFPEHPVVLRLLGLCHVRSGDAARGLALLERARALAPDDGYAELQYGIGLHAAERHAEAARSFRRALELLPGDPAPALNLAAARLLLGDAAGALSAARKAVLRAPKLAEAQYTLGLALLACERAKPAAPRLSVDAVAATAQEARGQGDLCAMPAAPFRLLAEDEPPPVVVRHRDATSPFVLTCDHAGRRLPGRLGRLGLPESELSRHIAWDIGAAGVARNLADRLDAWLVEQPYSRLVIDCNRSPDVPSSITTLSECTAVPGNEGLSAAEREARVREIFEPYHRSIAAELDARRRQGRPCVLVAVHSFTPVFKGVARPWHAGVLYNRDPRFARAVLELLRSDADLVVGDNQPYAVGDGTDYTIPVHGERRGLPHVELEIRQDLIAGAAGQQCWADRLAAILTQALRSLPDLAHDVDRRAGAI